MKKLLSIVLSSAIILSAGSAFAADAQKLVVNDKEVNLNGYKIFTEGENTIVPLRPSAEALGFTVTWNADTKTIELDNQQVNTKLTVGTDGYAKRSSQAIGLTQTIPLGYAPTVIEGRAYVPMTLYRLLFSNESAARVENDTVYLDAEKDSGKVEMPNPMVEYETVELAQNAAGFEFKLPEMPEGYRLSEVLVINQTVIDLRYQNGGDLITFRVGTQKGNISGVFTTFENEFQLEDAVVSGNGGRLSLASLEKNGLNYSIYSENGLTQDEMTKILQSL